MVAREESEVSSLLYSKGKHTFAASGGGEACDSTDSLYYFLQQKSFDSLPYYDTLAEEFPSPFLRYFLHVSSFVAPQNRKEDNRGSFISQRCSIWAKI